MREKCPVCGSNTAQYKYQVQERMLNRGGKFEYRLCDKCGCLYQVEEVDVSFYYKNDYYSYNNEAWNAGNFAKQAIKNTITRMVVAGWIPWHSVRFMRYLSVLYNTKLPYKSDILDVGGGSGNWIRMIGETGFANRLVNVDLFAPEEEETHFEQVRGTVFDLS